VQKLYSRYATLTNQDFHLGEQRGRDTAGRRSGCNDYPGHNLTFRIQAEFKGYATSRPYATELLGAVKMDIADREPDFFVNVTRTKK